MKLAKRLSSRFKSSDNLAEQAQEETTSPRQKQPKENKASKKGKEKAQPPPAQPQAPAVTPVLNPAPLPPNEKERIQELLSFKILDTDPTSKFDEITELAAAVCDVPVAIINLIDTDRAFLQSSVGTGGIKESPRNVSFCAYAILEPYRMTIVEDALLDDRFARNHLVLEAPRFRFYAGSPLVTSNGFPLGTLCTFDCKPRSLNDFQKRALEILSHQVMVQLNLHRQAQALKEVFQEHKRTHEELSEAIRLADAANVSSFENLLLSPLGVNSLLTFLKESQESLPLEFWMATSAFFSSFHKRSPAENHQQASDLFRTFLSPEAPTRLSLPTELTSPLLAALSKGEAIPPSFFSQVEKAALEILRKRPYERFQRSAPFRALTQEIHQVGYRRLLASGQA